MRASERRDLNKRVMLFCNDLILADYTNFNRLLITALREYYREDQFVQETLDQLEMYWRLKGEDQ